MMDYYEELGVDRSASADEIRQAYKHLVRLLHPDHCSDDRVRPLADLQMKRLNGVLRILTNPAEREIYDRSVFGGVCSQGMPPIFAVPLPPMPPPSRRTPAWFWPLAGAAAFLVLATLLSYTPQSPPRQIAIPEQPIVIGPSPPKKTIPKVVGSRVQGPIARNTTPAPLPAGNLPEPPVTPDVDDTPPDASPPTALTNDLQVISTETSNIGALAGHTAQIPLPAAPVLEPAHAPPGPRLAGVWLLAPSPHARSNGVYPPEYIELSLTEESGILHGRYRARYRILDQAISPWVSFQFEGQAGPDRASLPWSGTGGAKGEVRLRLLTPGTLEVSWTANQLGEELGLISGTATLVRKLD
jgi:hypothetical protein